MTLQPYIKSAGKYPVEWLPFPDFAGQRVDESAPPAGVLHTEEGTFDGSERIFAVHYAPHFTVGLHADKPTIRQHVPVGIIGAACRAHNNKARVEVELEAYSKEELWLPDPVRLDLLASLFAECWKVWQIPLTHPWPDGDFGRAGPNSHRSSGKYGHVAGWFGHGDMPSPDTHWDPGNLRWSEVFARAKALLRPAAPPPTPSKSPPPVS